MQELDRRFRPPAAEPSLEGRPRPENTLPNDLEIGVLVSGFLPQGRGYRSSPMRYGSVHLQRE